MNKQKIPRGVFARPKRRYPLVLLRKATDRSQKDVAKIAKMTQGEVCRIEQKRDARISALSRYARGLGGRVHVYVELGGHEYEIDLESGGEDLEAPPLRVARRVERTTGD
jgi:transcriptional regulator with XRE-family HTH domain